MKYLLDTATWLNSVTMPEVLPAAIRGLIEADEEKGLCSISLLEAAILHRLGRLDYSGKLSDFFALALSADLAVLELTAVVAAKTNEISRQFPGDPFDRAIMSTAAANKLTLITADPAIRDEKFCPVEFYPFKPARRGRTVL